MKKIKAWAVVYKGKTLTHQYVGGECSCSETYEGYSIHKTRKEAEEQMGWYSPQEVYSVKRITITIEETKK